MKKTWFEVWAIGYSASGEISDAEEFLGEFATKEEAVEQAKKFDSINQIYDADTIENYLDLDMYFEINVEEVQSTAGGTEAVDSDTIGIVRVKNN